MKKLLALVLALSMMLTVVSLASAAEITDLKTYELSSNELEYWNIFLSQGARDLNVLTNLLDGLLSNNPNGELVSAAAESWSSPDNGKTWIFKLRSGMTWSDVNGNVMADVKASDWVTGLEWVMNFAKNDSANTSMPTEMIVGADDYYAYTKELAEKDGAEAAKALGTEKFLEMVGIAADDEAGTVTYTCTAELAYFPTLATYNCLYPVSADLIAAIGVDGFHDADYTTIWYNGPYLIDSFISGNEKVLKQNPNWYGTDKRFNSVSIRMVESNDVAYQLFQTGDLDHVTLTESNVNTIYNNASNEFHDYLVEARPTKYSYQIHFNYAKNNDDGTPDDNWNKAVANENFRLSWYYGLDATAYLSRINAINPLSCVNYAYTANKVAVASDGTDYTSMVLDSLGLTYDSDTYARANAEKAAEYKAKAIEELTAAGVTFPVVAVFPIKGDSQTALDTAKTLQQMFSDYLGDDYVVLEIKTYVTNITTEIRNPRLQGFVINGWGADFGDPVNFLGQETYGEDNAYYTISYSNANLSTDENLIATYQEFTSLVSDARAITDNYDNRLAAFAKAEAYMVEHAITIPWYYNVAWELTCINNYTKIYCAYGIQALRYVNWETNDQIYTTADYEVLRAQ